MTTTSKPAPYSSEVPLDLIAMAADSLDAHGCPQHAANVRSLLAEIERLRQEARARRSSLASLGPCVPERLTRYRCALAANPRRTELGEDGARREDAAHAMLRAEREPEPR